MNPKYILPVVIEFLRKHFLSLFLIVTVSIWSLWPILKDPTKRIAEKWDGVMIVWILNQTVQKIPNDLANIFNGNIFYPNKNTMAYSDMLIPSGFISYLPVKIFSQPNIAVGTTLLFGQITSILICYFWFFEVTKNKTASLITSLALGVSVIRLGFVVHLQMWTMQWWLISIYCFWKYFKSRRITTLLISALFWGIQMWESPMGVYFALLAIILISFGNVKIILKEKVNFLLFLMTALLVMLLPARAYLAVSNEFDYVRSIRDAAHFSLGIDLLLKNLLTDGIFAGLMIMGLIINKKSKDGDFGWLKILLLVSLLLSLGPVLKIAGSTFKIFGKIFVPLPYGIFYYIIPGFSAFRSPGRWLMPALFAAGFIFCLKLTDLLKTTKVNIKNKIIFTLVVIMALLPLSKKIPYFEFKKTADYPKVYQFINKLPGGVLLELPVYSWAHGEKAAVETERMVYSLYHRKHLLGGASGFEPPSWNEVRNLYWQSFPSPEFDSLIKSKSVKYVLIWKDLVEEGRLEKIKKYYKHFEFEDDKYLLFSL